MLKTHKQILGGHSTAYDFGKWHNQFYNLKGKRIIHTLNGKPCCLALFRFLTTSAYTDTFFSTTGLLAKGTSPMPEGPDETLELEATETI